MARKSQIWNLIIQELRLARRSKYLVLSFIILPIAMWGLQGGFQYFIITQVEDIEETSFFEGQRLYFMNADQGNDSLNYGDMLYQNFTKLKDNRDNSLHGIELIKLDPTRNMSLEELRSTVLTERYSPLIYVNTTFTHKIVYYNQTEFDVPIVDLLYLPEDHRFGQAVYNSLWNIVNQSPYQYVEMIKDTDFDIEVVTYEGEEGAGNSFFIGFIGLIVIILAVMAPAPYVSSSFSGEKEKRTLESLIALPIKRFDILVSKLVSGMFLVSLFAIMNIIGLLFYQMIVERASTDSDIDLFSSSLSLDLSTLSSIFLMILLTSFASIGIGICIASLISDSRTAESVYTFSMLVPAMIVGMSSLYGDIPDASSPLMLIPWTHSLLVLNKGLFPQTYANSTISGAIYLDLFLHIGYLLAFVLVSLLVAAKLFDRESLIA